MIRKIFRNTRKLKFVSKSLYGSQMDWNNKGIGEVSVLNMNDEFYFFETITLDNGIKLNDKKMWKIKDDGIQIEFYHLRNKKYENIFNFILEKGIYVMKKKYECPPDNYFAKIVVIENNIYFIIKIKGIRKNEEIEYIYSE